MPKGCGHFAQEVSERTPWVCQVCAEVAQWRGVRHDVLRNEAGICLQTHSAVLGVLQSACK
jgi:hypothetical protein